MNNGAVLSRIMSRALIMAMDETKDLNSKSGRAGSVTSSAQLLHNISKVPVPAELATPEGSVWRHTNDKNYKK